MSTVVSSPHAVLKAVAWFGVGLFAWSLLEYAIHAWLGHTANRFAAVHLGHHREPQNVFAVGAWLPALSVWLGLLSLYGFGSGVLFYTGMSSGFVIYEVMHYRIHFSRPTNRLEARLRRYHLTHHFAAPQACFGVTTPLWDSVFRTGLSVQEMNAVAARVGAIPALTVPSNARRIFRPGVPARR